MIKLTLGDCRSTIAPLVAKPVASSVVRDYVNEAQQRLITRGKWVNTVSRYEICINEDCLTWPRQISTIEAWALCDTPGIIRNQWFEFLGNGTGLVGPNACSPRMLIDAGTAATFDQPTEASYVYVQSTVDDSGYIYVQGYDENSAWIRTQVGGSWIDGERIAISTAGTTSVTQFTNVTAIRKDSTDGPVRIFQKNITTGAIEKALGFYENDETNPIYRRSRIPGLSSSGTCSSCSDTDNECETKSLVVMTKLQHIPVVNDADWLILGNLPAIKDMVQSILKREKNLIQEAMMYEESALRELQYELKNHQGSGVVVPLRVEGNGTFGAGGVPNPIGIGRGYWPGGGGFR